jgi:hypothetical protein
MKEIFISVLDALLKRLRGDVEEEDNTSSISVGDISDPSSAQYAIVSNLENWDLEFELTSTVKLNSISPQQMLVKIDSVVMKGTDAFAENFIRQSSTTDLHSLITRLAESIAIHLVKADTNSIVVEDKSNKMLN